MISNGRRLVLTALLLAPMVGVAAPAVPAAATTPTAAPFTTAKISDLSGEVSITPASNPTAKTPAKLQDVFSAPDTLETGRRSHAELKAADGTIARVGSNTAFFLEPNSRTIHLQQGSILFNSPKGMGGGTIVTNSATATVLGTTIIVAATNNGGFKILVLEGHASVTFPGGQTVTLGPGQMTFVLPGKSGGGSSSGGSSGGSSSTASDSGGTSGGTSGGGSTGGTPGPVLNFDLSRQTSGSGLLNSFTVSPPSANLVVTSTQAQQLQISSGQLTQTNQAVVGAVSSTQVVLVTSDELNAATQTNPSNTNNNNTVLSSGSTTSLSLSEALASTVSLTSGGTLPASNIFTSPITFNASQLGIPNGALQNNSFSVTGIIAGDINLGGNVNLGQLDSLTEADLLAANTHTFTFTANTVFSGLSNATKLGLYSAGSFVFPTGANISTNFTPASYYDGEEYYSPGIELDIGSIGAMDLEQVSINNPSGAIDLSAVVGNLTMNGATISAFTGNFGNYYYDYYNNNELDIESHLGSVTITNSTITSGNNGDYYDYYDGQEVEIRAGGNVSVIGSTINAGNQSGEYYGGYMNVTALGNVNIANSTLNFYSLDVFGGALTTLTSSSLSSNYSYPYIQVAGATVNVSNVNFPANSSLQFWSANGQLSTDGSVAGDVNFSNVTYGGQPAQNYIDDGITLGITADNAAVQAALAENFTLPACSVPDGLVFGQVMFTPANLAAYVTDGIPQYFLFSGGIIVGNLSLSGNVVVAGNTALAANVNLTGSATVNVPNDDYFEVYVLGKLSTAANATLNLNFPNLVEDDDEEGDFYLTSFNTLSLSQVTINNPFGQIQLDSYEENDPGISLDTVSLSANSGIELDSYADGNVVVANSSLTANSGEISVYTDGSSGISISSSNLTSGADIYVEADYDYYYFNNNLSQNSSVSIQSSTVNAGSYLDIYGNGIVINASTLVAGGELYMSSFGNNPVSIQSSNLTGNSYVDIYAGDSYYYDNPNYYKGDLSIQSSNIISPNGTIYLSAGDTLAVSGSNLTSGDTQTLTANTVTVQDSTLQSNGNVCESSSYITVSGGTVVTVINSTLVATNVDLNAADVAGSTLTVNNLNLDTATSISMSARTISLSNVNFPDGSSVNLSSQNGLLAPNPNTNQAPIVNYVNFVTNVRYGGQPAQNFVPTSVGGSSSNPSAPIQISAISSH